MHGEIELFDKVMIWGLVKDQLKRVVDDVVRHENKYVKVPDILKEQLDYLTALEDKMSKAVQNDFKVKEWRYEE